MGSNIREVENGFLPLFNAEAIDGEIPMVEFRTNFNDSRLPPSEINPNWTNADQDQNNLITYDGSDNQSKREDPRKMLPLRKRIINIAMKAIDPGRAREILMEKVDTTDGCFNWGEEKFENHTQLYNCNPPPFMIPLITLSQIGVFIYYAIKLNTDDNKSNDVTAISGVPLSSPLIYSPYRRIQAWRFIGYMFLHQGYTHLIFNCLMQLFLGTILELLHKFWRVAIVYILGVLAGSLGHSCFDSTKYLVGASGGCYALFGAHLATVITNWNTMQKDWLHSPLNFLLSAVFRLIVIFLLAGADTGVAVYNRFVKGESVNVGFSAHFGGALAGFLVGVPVLRNIEIKSWEEKFFWICIVLYCLFMIGAIIFNAICAQKNLCLKTNWNMY